MKKIQFLFLLIMMSCHVMGNPLTLEGNNFTLQISFEENVSIKEAKLLGTNGTGINVETPANIFSGELDHYGVFNLSVTYVSKSDKKERNLNASLFLQPGETKLFIKKNTEQYIVSGVSAANQSMYKKLRTQDEALIKKIQGATTRLNQFIKNKDEVSIIKMKDSVHVLENKRKSLYGDFITKNPNSIMSLYALRMYSFINMENPLEVEKLLFTIADSLQRNGDVKDLKVRVEEAKKIMVGQPAPVFSQADTSGKLIKLTDLQGQYVLIDFWASWCKPCRAQNPALVKLYNQFRDKGFTILGVSLDSDKRNWVKAINEDHLDWLHTSDLRSWKNQAAIMYKIFSVPQNYLLDKKGKIIAKNLDEEELIKKLNEVTAKNL